MAKKKFTELPAATTPLAGDEIIAIVQGGVSKQTTIDDLPSGGGGGGTVDSVVAGLGISVDNTDPANPVVTNNGVNTITGAGVDNTDPLNPTMSFPEASEVTFTASGGISATDVNGALIELDAEKASITYVDNLVAGLKWKAPVRVATTVAGTLATSFENGDTVDGVVLATGNRILLKNQASATENGIYVVAASGAPTRSTDADSAAELEGAAVTVQEGTSNENTTWLQTTDSINLGVSNIVWGQFGSSVPDASETVKGIIEIATQDEVNTGTDDVRAVTPLKLATNIANNVYADLDFVLMSTLRNSYNY